MGLSHQKAHVTSELLTAIRELDNLFTLMSHDNHIITHNYEKIKDFVSVKQ